DEVVEHAADGRAGGAESDGGGVDVLGVAEGTVGRDGAGGVADDEPLHAGAGGRAGGAEDAALLRADDDAGGVDRVDGEVADGQVDTAAVGVAVEVVAGSPVAGAGAGGVADL